MSFADLDLSRIQFILFISLLVFILIQVILYLSIYLKPLFNVSAEKKKQIKYSDEKPGVSIIVYACNDSEHLSKNLPVILTQDYPEFEVIVVNDGSSEGSEDVLSAYENNYDNLYHTYLAEGARNLSRKKLSLTLGIKAAKHDILILTNANCTPNTNKWISNMVRNFTEKTEVVLGNTLFKTKKSERFIAFDILLRTLRIFGYTLSVSPFIGDGSNLAYRKELFFRHKGYAKFIHLHPGDDHLFVNQVCKNANTRVELSHESMVTASYDNTRQGWNQLKRDTVFNSKFYNSASKYIFGLDSFTRNLIPLIAVATLALFNYNMIYAISAVSITLVYWVLLGIFFYFAGKQLNSRRFIFLVPIFSYFSAASNFIFRASNFFRGKRNYTWHS